MTAVPLHLVSDPRFRAYDFGPEHPFQERPRGLAVRLLELSGLTEDRAAVTTTPGVEPAPRSELLRFHYEEYLDLVERLGQESGRSLLDSGDTPSFPGCYEAASRIAGGALEGLRAITEGKATRAFHPSGGLHHAHPGRASGFCIFNDAALAISKAIALDGPYRRVAYVDIDAHHGDGVMYGFYENGRVLDIDIHQDGRTLFPGTGSVEEIGRGDGEGLKANLPLPPGSGDAVFCDIFRRVVPTLLDSFRPDLVILQHGVDGHVEDRLAALRYTPAAYQMAVETLMECTGRLCEGRLLVTGGGGYSPEHVSRVLARTGVLLAGKPAPSGPLPAAWRAEFERELGQPAPASWTDPPDPDASDYDRSTSDALVRSLGRHLGTQFPAR